MLILEVVFDSVVQMNWDPQLFPSIVKDNFMEFTSMSVENRCRLVQNRCLLIDYDISCIVLVYVEAIGSKIDTQCPHTTSNFSIRPAIEDATCIWSKRDDISKLLQLWECLVDFDIVSLSVTFYCCSKASES